MARPARPSNRRPPAPPAPPPRPALRDFSGASTAFTIEWDVRPVYDFVFSLTADESWTHDIAEADRALARRGVERIRALPDAGIGEILDDECGIHVASFAVERPDIRTAAEFVAALETADLGDFYRAVMSDVVREAETRELVDRALDGDRSAVEALRAKTDPEWKGGPIRLLDEPERSRDRLVAMFRDWLELFAPIESRISAMLDRDYGLRAADRTSLESVELIERTTGGIRWLPESGVRRVILAPSYFTRPYNFLLGGSTWRFFAYPLSDDALADDDPLAAPQHVVRLHRALGDETRLRILKLLAGRDLYLTEIANALDLSKPTIKHHLALLRAAGLVTVTEAGAVMYYSLRRSGLDEASADLKRFLLS